MAAVAPSLQVSCSRPYLPSSRASVPPCSCRGTAMILLHWPAASSAPRARVQVSAVLAGQGCICRRNMIQMDEVSDHRCGHCLCCTASEHAMQKVSSPVRCPCLNGVCCHCLGPESRFIRRTLPWEVEVEKDFREELCSTEGRCEGALISESERKRSAPSKPQSQ